MKTPMGFEGVLQYKIGGQAAGGSYTTLTNVVDVELPATSASAEVATRAGGGFTSHEVGLHDLPLTFKMVYDEDDANMIALRDAWLARTMVAFKFLSETGAQATTADFKIHAFGRPQMISDVQYVNVEAKLARSATPPTYGA